MSVFVANYEQSLFRMLERKQTKTIFASVFLGLLVASSFITGLSNILNHVPFDASFTSQTPGAITILMSVSTIDLNAYSMKLHWRIRPMGTFLWMLFWFEIESSDTNLNIRLDEKSYSFTNGINVGSQDFTNPISSGDISSYPFDYFETDFIITCDTIDRNITQSAPITVRLDSYIQGWGFQTTLRPFKNQVQVVILVYRSNTIKIFAVFVFFIMWIISVLGKIITTLNWTNNFSTVFRVSASFIILDQSPPPPMIAVAGAMLFALPAIRNTMPGAPQIGSLADMFGFYFNMLILSSFYFIQSHWLNIKFLCVCSFGSSTLFSINAFFQL